MAQVATRQQRIRVLGSGYTLFYYAGGKINLAQTIQDRAPDPVAPPQAVQPLDKRHPIEIAFPRAVREGALTVVIFDQWQRDVWRQFFGFKNGVFSDLADIFDRSSQVGGVQCAKVITDPQGNKRLVQYLGSMITNVDMSETVAIDTLTIGRAVTITYLQRKIVGG